MEDRAEIRRLRRAAGLPIKMIARTLGISRNTVRVALASEGPPKYARKPAGVDAFEDAIAYDDELYCVSTLLHDIGLREPFDSRRLPFEVAGTIWHGCPAPWLAGRPSGRPGRRKSPCCNCEDVPAAVDPESHILQVATSREVFRSSLARQ